MSLTSIKKHTAGTTAGITWEKGEVKAVNSYLADELVVLAPEDFEIVEKGEVKPAAPAHNPPGAEIPTITSTGDSIEVQNPETTVVEVTNHAESAEKAPRTVKKAKAPSAE